MPSHTISFDLGQYNYIHDTADGNISERVRELVDKGIGVEQDE